ncbi:mucin-binding protein [Limosilactobacillus fermentum]
MSTRPRRSRQATLANRGQPINPNDPNGPKWPAGTGASDLVKGATQTIHYQGVGGVEDSVTTIKGAFEKTVTVDLITGKIVSETDFTGQANFETVKTPVVNGYHADKALAGGLTATPDQPNVSDTVTYQANGKVVPVDENGKPILGADQPTYPTDPSDPTKVSAGSSTSGAGLHDQDDYRDAK